MRRRVVKRHKSKKEGFSLLDDHVGLDFLDKKKYKSKIKKQKSKKQQLVKEKDKIREQIMNTKTSMGPQESIDEKLKLLKKSKKKLNKKIKKRKQKAKDLKRQLQQFDERYDISYEVEQIVNSDGLFRTPDTRYIDNGLFERSIHTVGMMLNHAQPNYRKIGAVVESIIGNLSLCMCEPQTIDYKLVEIFTNYVLAHKPILDVIDPFAVVLYNKFLILSHLSGYSIVYECDRITKSTKFSTAYRRYCEGKYAFDQFVDFSKFQRRYMTQEQQILFSQYQRVIRVLEDMGYVDCKSGKFKQRVRNGMRDLGIKRSQIGEMIHYTYDKSLDAARQYYASKDPRLNGMFDYLQHITQFTPEYAGERYAMSRF